MLRVRLNHLTDTVSARGSALFAESGPPAAAVRWSAFVLLLLVLAAAVLRFWDVGTFSLHKPDEDTTALAAVHILQDGTPRFPSGMFYARAIAQSYMIAGSVKAFGQTEWALRLPSVLCGLLVVLLAYWMGRRFLRPGWNLAFSACIACLPGMIADSQEARMYIFMVASLAAYAALVFEWERSGRRSLLLAAVAVMLVGVQFHQLVVFGALLVLLPGLCRRDGDKLLQGVLALAAIGVGYVAISRWIGSFYPDAAGGYTTTTAPQLGVVPTAPGGLRALFGVGAALLAAATAWYMTRTLRPGFSLHVIRVLIFLGLLSQGALYYHIGALFLLAAVVMMQRAQALSRGRLAVLLAVCLGLAIIHVVVLHVTGVESARKIVGILVGRPSVWQYLMVGTYSPIAAAIVLIGLIQAGVRVANRQPVADYWLLFLLAVWIPLLAVGVFGWYFPPRYVEFALLPFLLTAFACCQQWVAAYRVQAPRMGPVVAVVACVAIVNPFAMLRAVNAGQTFADHRSAARFIRSTRLGPKDVIIAEEVLMQTYYLGHIDYWLQKPSFAAGFLILVNGRYVDEYTDTPILGTAPELEALLMKPGRGAIYVIGSGENFDAGQRPMRGEEIDALLHSRQFEPVFVARDGLTTVWKSAPTDSGLVAQ